MEIDKNSDLYKELILRSKIVECCKSCRHYTIKLEDDFCTKKDAFIYGCPCNKKARYLNHFGLSETDLNWDVSLPD